MKKPATIYAEMVDLQIEDSLGFMEWIFNEYSAEELEEIKNKLYSKEEKKSILERIFGRKLF